MLVHAREQIEDRRFPDVWLACKRDGTSASLDWHGDFFGSHAADKNPRSFPKPQGDLSASQAYQQGSSDVPSHDLHRRSNREAKGSEAGNQIATTLQSSHLSGLPWP